MQPDNLSYTNLKARLETYEQRGRGESVAFLTWFLENIFRLDPIDADDAVCDKPNDKGVDGIFVNHLQNEVWVLQGKVKQKESSLGDQPLRELSGTLSQFDDGDSVQSLIDGGANEELKRLLLRHGIRSLVEKGYSVKGVMISNQKLDANGAEFEAQDDAIIVYDRNKIASEFIDLETEGGVSSKFEFELDYVDPMIIETGKKAVSYFYPVKAIELASMEGIQDGTLFSLNVRQSLGNTKVNKALTQSVKDTAEHPNFPLYHNGVTILCKSAELLDGKLKISDYVVVNGAQSISTFHKNADVLTADLRVLAKIIQLDDAELSRQITVNSNNQNSIKPRDLKSTNDVQVRLKEEFAIDFPGKYSYEIKRGQSLDDDTETITNEEAGRLLLAFDLHEPYTCHQVYKLFDDKYTEIFARPDVTAKRIVLLHEISRTVNGKCAEIAYQPLAKYGLTRFFLLSTISKILETSEEGLAILRDPSIIFDNEIMEKFLGVVSEVLASIVIDLNYEVEQMGNEFDYKGDLKSPVKVKDLRNKLLRSYEKDVKRNKATEFVGIVS